MSAAEPQVPLAAFSEWTIATRKALAKTHPHVPCIDAFAVVMAFPDHPDVPDIRQLVPTLRAMRVLYACNHPLSVTLVVGDDEDAQALIASIVNPPPPDFLEGGTTGDAVLDAHLSGLSPFDLGRMVYPSDTQH